MTPVTPTNGKVLVTGNMCKREVQELERLREELDRDPIVAVGMDVMVHCSRKGEVSRVHMATRAGKLVEFWVIPRARDHPMVNFLREVLQSSEIVKVMHGCATRADMLHHRLGITLTSVYDTQVAHEALTGQIRSGYTAALVHNEIGTPRLHGLWLSGVEAPLVTNLQLADGQISGAGAGLQATVFDATAKKIAFVVGAELYRAEPKSMHEFAGSMGRLERESGTHLCLYDGSILVYYDGESDLNRVKEALVPEKPYVPWWAPGRD